MFENVIRRNVISNGGAAEADDDIFDYHSLRNVTFISLY